MEKNEVIIKLKKIIDDTGTAVLATAGSSNIPGMRWMTPVFLKNDRDNIYAVTSSRFSKIPDIKDNNKVQWMFQSKALDLIINVDCEISIQENPAVEAEVLQAMGVRLNTFWTVNKDSSSLVVLESRIIKASVFTPVKSQKYLITF